MKPTIATLCGSLRRDSINQGLITAIAAMGTDEFDLVRLDTSTLPAFSPDLDATEHQALVPDSVKAFRETVLASDGVLIVTPEYAMGYPGTLKNALDWTVSHASLAQKPTALITCAALGQAAHPALMSVLKVLEARISTETQLIISHNRTKITPDGQFLCEDTRQDVLHLMHSLLSVLEPT